MTDGNAPPNGAGYTKNNSQYKSNFIGRYTIGSYEPNPIYKMIYWKKMDSNGNNNNWWKIYYDGATGITPSTANSINFLLSLGLEYPQQMFPANFEILTNVVMRILWKGKSSST